MIEKPLECETTKAQSFEISRRLCLASAAAALGGIGVPAQASSVLAGDNRLQPQFRRIELQK